MTISGPTKEVEKKELKKEGRKQDRRHESEAERRKIEIDNWDEKMISNATKRIPMKNIDDHIRNIQRKLKFDNDEFANSIRELTRKCKDMRATSVVKGKISPTSGILGIFSCAREDDGSVSIAYAIHTVDYKMKDHNLIPLTKDGFKVSGLKYTGWDKEDGLEKKDVKSSEDMERYQKKCTVSAFNKLGVNVELSAAWTEIAQFRGEDKNHDELESWEWPQKITIEKWDEKIYSNVTKRIKFNQMDTFIRSLERTLEEKLKLPDHDRVEDFSNIIKKMGRTLKDGTHTQTFAVTGKISTTSGMFGIFSFEREYGETFSVVHAIHTIDYKMEFQEKVDGFKVYGLKVGFQKEDVQSIEDMERYQEQCALSTLKKLGVNLDLPAARKDDVGSSRHKTSTPYENTHSFSHAKTDPNGGAEEMDQD